jgi:hypothetical protein
VSTLLESTELAKHFEHVSPSSLNRFIRCPENFRQRYILGIKDVAGAKALQGSADSVAYADYYRASMSGVETPLSVLEDVYRDTLHAKADEYDLEDETKDSLVDKGIPGLRAYYEVAKRMPTPVAVEERILIERASLPVPVLGYLDVEFPEIIIDRKGAANRSMHPDWRLQLRIYSAARDKPAGVHITSRTKVPAVYTPDDGEEYQESWSQAKANRTIRMCGQIESQIESLLLMFGPDETWPTLGLSHAWACGRCPYKKDCEAWA